MTVLYFSQSRVEGEEEEEARGTGRGGREMGNERMGWRKGRWSERAGRVGKGEREG